MQFSTQSLRASQDAASNTSVSSRAGLSSPSPEQESPQEPQRDPAHLTKPSTDILALMRRSDLFNNIRKPRNVIVLCHGLYGFDFRGPFWGLEIHYWAAVLDILRKKIGADVIVRGVPGTGSIAQRAKALHEFLCSDEAGIRGANVNFVGHSMGGLDARYLVSHLRPKPEEYTPVSVTSISTPHKGSPFMDWCNANVGIGNEYVEECIREYELKKGMWRSPGEETATATTSEKLPYSLKTPLFVRPKKTNSQGNSKSPEAIETSQLQAVKANVGDAVDEIGRSLEAVGSSSGKTPADSRSKADVPPTKATSKSSLDVVTPLTRALSSLTGYFSSYMLSVFDTPAYAMLSTKYMAKVFNPSTPNMPNVKYFSVAARTSKIPLWHPLWLPRVILDAAAEARTAGSERDGSAAALGNPDIQGNDGLVSIQSARWGTFLGVVDGCDHWDLRGGGAPRWGTDRTINPATGKPWRSAKEAQKAQAKDDEMRAAAEAEAEKNKKKSASDEDGWLAINRLLRGLVGSRSKSDSVREAENLSEAEAKQPASSGAEDAATTLPSSVSPAHQSQQTQAPPSDQSKAQSPAAAKDASAVASARENAQAFLEQYAIVPGLSGSDSATQRGNRKDDQQQDEGFMDEVASWISDRLPQGSEERRQLADETNRVQEEELRLSVLPPRISQSDSARSSSTNGNETSWAGSDVHGSDSAGAETVDDDRRLRQQEGMTLGSTPTVESVHVPRVAVSVAQEQNGGSKPQHHGQETASALERPTPSPLVNVTNQVSLSESLSADQQPKRSSNGEHQAAQKLRRDSEWFSSSEDSVFGGAAGSSPSSSSSSSSARSLRRELEWHREERNKQRQREANNFAANGDGGGVEPPSKKRKSSSGSESTSSEKERLERFWIALCQHLYSHGL